MELILRELNSADEIVFLDGLKEWVGESPHWYSFIWNDQMDYKAMLAILRKDFIGLDLAPGRVPHTMLYGFLNGQIIGRVSVRHSLNENLRQRGGHIGYAVAPRFRNKGLASQMVKQALTYCKSLGLEKILITCSDENVPSWKIIEKFGGILEDKVWDDVDKETIRRYWVSIA